MSRKEKDWDWTMPGTHSYDSAQLSVLMDIRDELKLVNQRLADANYKLSPLQCTNFLKIPRTLDAIKKNTTRKKPIKKAVRL